jgi:hypothetical protein
MFGSDSLSGLDFRLRSQHSGRLRPRRADRRLQVAAELLRLEDRCMLSGTAELHSLAQVFTAVVRGHHSDRTVETVSVHRGRRQPAHVYLQDQLPANQFPTSQVTNAVPLSDIIWNGGPAMPGAPWNMSFPSPSEAGAMKTITLTNNGPEMIYPFIRGENLGQDPNATSPNKYYDPQDALGLEYREYIGYQTPDGTFVGLPTGASITFQVPLVLWDGDNMYIATDPADLTAPTQIYNYDPTAKISIATYTGQGSTQWITSASNYQAGQTPAVVFYRSPTPKTVLPAAPAQLVEWTFRDPYLKQFINDPLQTFPLINYDVSYVNNLTSPISIDANNVPITFGDRLNATTPPTYYGYKNFGWNPTDRHTKAFEDPIKEFVKKGNSILGDYFGGEGWPEYYNPNDKDIVIPSGANVFDNSPVTVGPPTAPATVNTSPYDPQGNHWLLTSNGPEPIRLASIGAMYSSLDTIHFAPNYEPQLKLLKNYLDSDKKNKLDVNASLGDYPAGTEVTAVDPTDLTVTVNNTHEGTVNDGVYDFVRPVNDYAVKDITDLWYSWAKYYAGLFPTDFSSTVAANLNYYVPPGQTNPSTQPLNEFTLTSAPLKGQELHAGMTVTGTGIPAGTTILNMTGPDGAPISKADAIGDNIYLSMIPGNSTPASQQYTFGAPKPISLGSGAGFTKPYDLTFSDADKADAERFAGSVYEAMVAESPIVPTIYLPYSAQLVDNVIKFNAVLPGYNVPDVGPILVGDVRDVVKSILRGVWNFVAVPNQKDWYPDPAKSTGGKDFNVFNIDPYVYFVHVVEQMDGYAFSVDDDVANPAAPGPVLAASSTPGNPVDNHTPNNLEIGFGGIDGFVNPNAWYPTIPWGKIDTTATITKVGGDGEYKDDYMITLNGDKMGDSALTLFNEINNPGPGQTGAYVSSPGYLIKGTTLIFKGPNGADQPQIVLSEPPIKPTKPGETVPISITAGVAPPD